MFLCVFGLFCMVMFLTRGVFARPYLYFGLLLVAMGGDIALRELRTAQLPGPVTAKVQWPIQ